VWREIPGDELSRGNFTLGGFNRIPIQNYFVTFTFSLPTEFCMWRCSRGIVQELFAVRLDFREKLSTECGAIEKTIKNKILFK